MLGLVLTAGGARGAYQAGVLKRIGEIRSLDGRPSPFRIIAGASAGAINGTMLAAGASDPRGSTAELARLWSELQVKDVFRVDVGSLTAGGLRWLQDLSLGGLFGGGNAQALLDTSPLRSFLGAKFPTTGVAESIHRGHLYALAVSATCYYSGKSFTFIQGQQGHPVWRKARRIALPVEIRLEHILASSAIPIVFPPVFVKTPVGDFYFGDGGLRLVTPLSPAIRLGADRLLAIGIRSQHMAEERSRLSLLEPEEAEGTPTMRKPPLAQIFGVFLNAIFLDHLDTDLDHLRRMNELIYYFGSVQYGPDAAQAVGAAGTGGRAPGPTAGERPPMSEPMRIVLPYVINPSEDLANVAEAFASRMPRMVRFAMEGLGSSKAQSADLLSYLLFDSEYTRALVEIGYRDAAAQIDQIEAFLLDPRSAVEASSAA